MFRPVAKRQPRIVEAGHRLLGRRRFPGQGGLVNGEVDGLRHTRVGGNPVAGAQEHHVARHQVARRNDDFLCVAQHVCDGRRHFPQRLERLPGTMFLDKAEQHREQHDHGDDDGLEGVTEEP